VIDKKTVATAEYIVKSSGEDYPFLAQNEFMCMSVARAAGIQVPPFWLSADGGLFMMERFDRTADGQKFGLEDMVVLMGKTANEKYHGSYESIAKAIDLYCGEHAAESKARFFEYLAVSALLKNGDAHLKNFSLLYDVPTGAIKLSPLYDVVSTIIYEIVNPKTGATRVDNSMALQMFKQKSFPVNAELIQFGKSVCMVNNPQDVIERIEEAKHFVMRKHANEMDPSLITKLKMAWRI
jgi:serine/threonine-protein kinase HipA